MKSILPLAVFLSLTGAAFAQKNPDEALKTFTVAEGLQLELFASEPMFVNPTCIDVDHKGRVWVCESVNYRCDLRKAKRNRAEGDRLVVLEDTDGDGNADKAHTFYQEKDFIAPLGVAVMPYPDGKGQRIYVCHSPHIYVFEDKDGDLKADAPPKILLTGFKGYDHDHGVHGIHFGPDGKLYFSVGDQGVDKLSSANGNFLEKKGEPGGTGPGGTEPGGTEPGGTEPGGTGVPAGPGQARGLSHLNAAKERVHTTNRTDCQAGTCWRCNPDGTGLELLAHNFRNQYEPAVDSFGTMFTSDNDDDGNQQTRICYVMYGGNHGYWPRNKGDHHWHEDQPGVVHKVLRTGFGSPTGLCWYEATLLPVRRFAREPAYGYLLHTDAGPREVRCFVVKPKGAGYELDKINLVTSTDNWFRPSDVCVAPDGSVMVADWYDPGVGGHGMGDTTRGRIYRLTPKGHKGYKVPAVDVTTEAGLLDTLSSPNIATRYLVFQKTSGTDLQRLHANFRDEPKRMENIWFVARLTWLLNQKPLTDPDKRFAFFTYIPEARTTRTLELFVRQLKDQYQDITVPTRSPMDFDNFKSTTDGMTQRFGTQSGYRELLLALRDEDPRRVKDWIWDLAKRYDGHDPFYLAAINIAVGTDAKRREIILADFEKHFPEWNDKTAKLVWELRPPAVIAKLDQKLADPKLTAGQKAFVLEILAVSDGIEPGLAMLKLLEGDPTPELRQQALKSLVQYLPSKWSTLKKRPELEAAAAKLIRNPATRLLAIELIAAAELETGADTLAQWAEDRNMDRGVRVAAVRGLSAFKSDGVINFLAKLIDDDALPVEAIQALGQVKTDRSITPLKVVVLDQKRPRALRQEAVAALAGSRDGTRWLLEEHAKKVLPADIVADAARLLRNSPHQDLRNRAMIAFPAPGKLDPKKLPPIAALAKRTGDVTHGRQLFLNSKDLGCIRCHSVRGAGGNIGPDLSMIGKKGSRENLFESLLDPDKAVADQYVQWIVLDDKGVTLTGLVVEDNAHGITIRDANGKDTKIATANIDERKKIPKSIMPSDLVAYMSEHDLVDIVAYLETLKTPALVVDQWHILGPFDNGADDAGLDKEYIPEPGKNIGDSRPRLAGSFEGKHGKISWRTVKPNAESYIDLAAFFAPQSSQIVSYLYREIESPADQEATILIGADDGCNLWVNGAQVLRHRRHEAATPERDTIKVKLQKGANSILLKINNGDGPHGFYFTVVSEQELKLQAGELKGGQR